MSERRLALLNRGLVVGSAFAALVLLAVFYTVVSGAVDRAASRRAEMSAVAPSALPAAEPLARSGAPMAGRTLLLAGSAR